MLFRHAIVSWAMLGFSDITSSASSDDRLHASIPDVLAKQLSAIIFARDATTRNVSSSVSTPETHRATYSPRLERIYLSVVQSPGYSADVPMAHNIVGHHAPRHEYSGERIFQGDACALRGDNLFDVAQCLHSGLIFV